jgi:TonB family protein
MRKKYFIYQPEPVSKSTVKIILYSLAVCLSIFLFLPLSETLLRKDPKLEIRQVRTVSFKRKIPEPVQYPDKEVTERIEKPKLETIEKKIEPGLIPVDLEFDIKESFKEISYDFKTDHDIFTGSFSLNEVDSPPQIIVHIPPFYPPEAEIRGIEGEAQLLFTVTESGNVKNIVVESSKPGKIFDSAAVDSVKRWRFRPALKSGKPVPVRVRQEVKFKLEK